MESFIDNIFNCFEPEQKKEYFITRMCLIASKPFHSESAINSVLQVSWNWALEGETALQASSGIKVFTAWSSHNCKLFQCFFTPALVKDVLVQRVRHHNNIPLLLRQGFRILTNSGTHMHCEHSQTVQHNLTKFVCRTEGHFILHNVRLLLTEFSECVPSDKREILKFTLAVVKHHSIGVKFKEVDCLEKLNGTVQRLKHSRHPETRRVMKILSRLIECHYLPNGNEEPLQAILDLIKECSQCTVQHAIEPPLAVSSNKSNSEPKMTGLENLGSTCYINSVIQALYMLDEFRIGVLRKIPTKTEALLAQLQYVFAFLSHSRRPTVKPRIFLQSSRPAWFVCGEQQDCSEYLKYILNKLDDEEKLSFHSKMTSSDKDTLNSIDRKKNAAVMQTAVSLNSVGDESIENKTLIEKMFTGKTESTIMCLFCKHSSFRTEDFLDLLLAFPNPSGSMNKNLAGGGDLPSSEYLQEAELLSPLKNCFNIKDLISLYLLPEKLNGNNRFYCDRCGKLQDAERHIKIIKSPEHLILTLLRFSYDPITKKKSKTFQNVCFAQNLFLPVWSDSKIKQCFKSHELYCLSSVIVHSGTSSGCGHYYCYGRNSQTGPFEAGLLDKSSDTIENLALLPDRWYCLNDTSVSQATFMDIRNMSTICENTPYVFIYRKLSLGFPSLFVDTGLTLRQDLMEAIIKDNDAYVKEQEQAKKKRN